MWLLRFFAGIVTVGVISFPGAELVSGQDYPNRPIRIVVGAVGGGNDAMARLLAQRIAIPLGQSVIVDNRASGGTVPVDIVSKAAPDGYSLLLYGSATWIAPLFRSTSYDPITDFSPVTVGEKSPNVLVVHPSVAATSVKEFIALAKAKPGALNYSSGGTGGSTHLSAELFKSMAGVNIIRVPYSSGSVEYSDLVGGQVQLTFGGATSVAPHVKSGKLRALAVTITQPSAQFPGLPTIAETVPGYDAASYTVILAPAKTPDAIIRRLNQEIVRVLNQADTKEKLLSMGIEAVGSTPQELAATMKSEIAKWGKLIKDVGIKSN